MTHLHFQDLRRRVEAVELEWAWAIPHIYEWVDPDGKVYERFENKAYRLYEKAQAAHEAEMARLEAELENDAPAPRPVPKPGALPPAVLTPPLVPLPPATTLGMAAPGRTANRDGPRTATGRSDSSG